MAAIVAKRVARGIVTALALIATSVANGVAQEGRIEEVRLRSPALEANRLGDSAERRILVYLPTGYDLTPERSYPVVYHFARGRGGGGRSTLTGLIANTGR